MSFKYHELPFGAQLLFWTSRVYIHGSCRSNPNKYQLVDLAYKKAGVDNGCYLLNEFLNILKLTGFLDLQSICSQNLTECEINLIRCIEEHKKEYINNKYFIKVWNLDDAADSFSHIAKSLALALKNAGLCTNIGFETDIQKRNPITKEISKTLH